MTQLDVTRFGPMFYEELVAEMGARTAFHALAVIGLSVAFGMAMAISRRSGCSYSQRLLELNGCDPDTFMRSWAR